MIHVKCEYPAGTIIVACGLQPRYHEFQMSLEGLYVPDGTKLYLERSCDVTSNFNNGLKKLKGEWAWFLGDDHSFDEKLLMRFLKHNVDVVVPISPCKVPPWLPCVIHGPEQGEAYWHEDMFLYDWDQLSGIGLLPLPKGDFIGQSGMLVKKAVLDSIGYPWFKCGQLDPGRLQEDLHFCHVLQEKGYTVNVDQEVVFDHYTAIAVTARRHHGKYVPAIKSGKHVVVLPGAKPEFDPNIKWGAQGQRPVRWAKLPRTAEEEAAISSIVDAGPTPLSVAQENV